MAIKVSLFVDGRGAIAGVNKFNKSVMGLSSSIDQGSKKTSRFNSFLGKNRAAMRNSQAATSRFSGSVDRASSAMNTFLGTLGSQIVFATLSRGLNTAIGGFRSVTAEAIKFDQTLAEVNTIAGLSESRLSELRSELLSLSSAYGEDVTSQTRAFYQIQSAGITDAAQALDVLTAANKLAVAGNADTTQSIEAILGIMKAYEKDNISAAEATDILFTTIKAGRTTLSQFGNNIGVLLAPAANLGIKAHELSTLFAAVTTTVGKTEESITGLRGIMTAIQNPTSEATKTINQLKEAAGLLDFQFNQTYLRQVGGIRFFKELNKIIGTNKEALSGLSNNVRAQLGFTALLGDNFENLSQVADQFSQRQGNANEAARIALETVSKQADIVGTQIKNLFIAALDVFNEPIIDFLRQFNEQLKSDGPKLAAESVALLAQGLSIAALTFSTLIEQGDVFLRYTKKFWFYLQKHMVIPIQKLFSSVEKDRSLDAWIKRTEISLKKADEAVDGYFSKLSEHTARLAVKIDMATHDQERNTEAIRKSIPAIKEATSATELDTIAKESNINASQKQVSSNNTLLENLKNYFNKSLELRQTHDRDIRIIEESGFRESLDSLAKHNRDKIYEEQIYQAALIEDVTQRNKRLFKIQRNIENELTKLKEKGANDRIGIARQETDQLIAEANVRQSSYSPTGQTTGFTSTTRATAEESGKYGFPVIPEPKRAEPIKRARSILPTTQTQAPVNITLNIESGSLSGNKLDQETITELANKLNELIDNSNLRIINA